MWHNLPFGRATPWFRYGVPRPLRVPVPLSYARRGVCARNPRPDRKSDCPVTKRSRAPAPGGRGTEARLGESPGAGGMCVGTWLMCGGELGKGCEVGSARTPVPTRTPVPRSLVPALLGIEAAFLRHVCAALHHQAHAGGNPAPPGVSSPVAATPGRNAGAHSAASLAAECRLGPRTDAAKSPASAARHRACPMSSTHSMHVSGTTHAPHLSSANSRPPTG